MGLFGSSLHSNHSLMGVGMKKITENAMVAQFRQHFEDKTGQKIDFRKHQFLRNSYGNTPIFYHEFAVVVIEEWYAWLNQFIKDNQGRLHELDGIEYNTQMSCDKLRIGTLKRLLYSDCSDVVARQIKG